MKVWERARSLFPIIVLGAGFAVAIIASYGIPQPVIAQACPLDSTDFICWSKHYQDIVKQKSAAEAFKDLKTTYAKSPYVRGECHQLTHVIGRAEAQKYDSVGKAYTYGDSFCWSGYYHGAIEAFAKRYGEGKFISGINDICKELREKSRYSFYHYNCAHGVGHGVMAVEDNELFKALGDCENVTDSWERSSCYGGVFMENIMSDPATNKEHKTKYLHADQPLYPCTAVDMQFKEQCYLMQTSYALRQVNFDFKKGFGQCESVESAFQNICFQSLGRDASGNSVSDVTQTNRSCNLGNSQTAQLNCAVGAVKDFISYYHDDRKAKDFCRSFSDNTIQTSCLETAANYYQTF